MVTEKESKIIYCIKAFAIFGVCCGHCVAVPENSTAGVRIVSELFFRYGTFCTPAFLLLAGFFFAGSKKDFKTFWKNKITTVVVPWLFCETMLWLYVVVRSGEWSAWYWLKFVMGYQSAAYFMSMLMVMYLLFWKAKTSRWYFNVLLIASIIDVLPIFNEIAGYLDWHTPLTAYLMPLNWMVYFGLGMLIHSYNCMGLFVYLSKITLVPGLILLTILNFSEKVSWGYFSGNALGNALLIFFIVLGLSTILVEQNRGSWLLTIGKWSFSIYLTHQFLTGIIVHFTQSQTAWPLILVRPVLVFGFTVAGLIILRWICEKNEKLKKVVYLLIGMR